MTSRIRSLHPGLPTGNQSALRFAVLKPDKPPPFAVALVQLWRALAYAKQSPCAP